MTLMTIKDFRARPCSIEYLTLYSACTSLLLSITAASFGQLEPAWGIAIFCYLILSMAFLGFCRFKRNARATQFYIEWLRALPNSDLATLTYRLKAQSKERELVNSLHIEALSKPKAKCKRPTLA
ncbi:hypothetical protein [Glaciecola sp. SC05]|uniref:hypothetical protein n=1 Tax=Glaciecola sp. SC05 TaxID=1987355 RepID=UPI0035294E2D